MGQPKGGGTSSGGGGGGGSSAPKKKKDNGTSKYFKSTSKPVAKTPSAKTLAEQYGLKGAGEAAAKTKAVATPAAKAIPKKTVKAKPPAAPKVSVIKAPTISAAPAAKIEAAPAKESFGVLKSDTAAKRDTTSATFISDTTKRAIPKAITSISEPDALSAKPKVDAASVREKAYEKAAEPKAATSIPPLIAKPSKVNEPVKQPSLVEKIKAATDVVKPKVEPAPNVEVPKKPAANIPPLIAKPPAAVEPKVINAPKAKEVAASIQSKNVDVEGWAAKQKVIQGNLKQQAEDVASGKKASLPAKHIETFDQATYAAKAAEGKEGGVLGKVSGIAGAIVADKYRNDETSYNQAYWASRLAGGATQAELAAEQKAIGMKKAYSGDVVVTPDMQKKAADDLKRVTGSMAVIDDPKMPEAEKESLKKAGIDVGGVTKTEKKSGLLGELRLGDKKTTTDYAYKKGPVITTKATDPVIKTPLGELRLGEKTSTTYVGGVEVATKTGGDELGVGAKVTQAEAPAHIADTTKIEPMDGLNTVEDVQKAIESTTDKKELASLHERLRSLMRAMRTRTKFGGLAIGQAETEATKLGGLRIK